MSTESINERVQDILRLPNEGIRDLFGEEGISDEKFHKLTRQKDRLQENILELLKRFCGAKLYPEGYNGPRPIAEQIRQVAKLFGLDETSVLKDSQYLPKIKHTEGWFAIPRWEKIASTYNEALEIVLNMIKQTRSDNFRIDSNREGKIGPKYLRRHKHTNCNPWEEINKELDKMFGFRQRDILLVPAQFGMRHAACTLSLAQSMCGFSDFFMGAYEGAVMLLLHPERLGSSPNCADISCAGDRFTSSTGLFDRIPTFITRKESISSFTAGDFHLPDPWNAWVTGTIPREEEFVSQRMIRFSR